MENQPLNDFQLREVFQLEFLRAFNQIMIHQNYAVKGGVNMRLFFDGIRYCQIMEIDIHAVGNNTLADTVSEITASAVILDGLQNLGIKKISPPKTPKADNTGTKQRFKLQITTYSAASNPFNIHFLHSPVLGRILTEPVPAAILQHYNMPSLVIKHYDAYSSFAQKVNALSNPKTYVIRDIFDIYILSSQLIDKSSLIDIDPAVAKLAAENVNTTSFLRFRDVLLNYLENNDKITYGNRDAWDDIKGKVIKLITPNT